MLPEKIMQSDLLDILFENRNKIYGAYALRKSYNKTLVYATTCTFFIAALFSFFQFIHGKNTSEMVSPVIYVQDNEISQIDPPQKPPEPAAAKPVQQKISQKILSVPVISKDIVNTQMPTMDEFDKSLVGPVNITGDDDKGIQPPVVAVEGKGNGVAQPVKKEEVHEGPLTVAQVMPEYPGGIEALKKFMLKNLRQPDDLQPGEKIVVRAFFVVNMEGKIEEVKIISEGREDLNKEVKRVINKMPLWKPGIQNGRAVAVYFNLPVTFMSNEE